MSDPTSEPASDPWAGDAIVIERVLDAPIDTVWRMWTDPAHFAAWYGPDGAAVPELTLDVRPGGQRLVCMEMSTPGGPHRMWFGGTHVEVVPPRRLVYTEAITDEHGRPLPPDEVGMPPGHPAVTRVTVELTGAGDDRTRMVMTHAGVPADSPGATGWEMAFGKLVAHLGGLGGLERLGGR